MANPPVFDLSGRTALVTGASSGLGARFAQLLAASGARVALAARRTAELNRIVEKIRREDGQAVAVAMDVTVEQSVVDAYDQIESAFGTVDTIIANAGVSTQGKATDQSVNEFDRTLAVNMRGTFLTAREGTKRMIGAGSRESQLGRIVIISSITADVVSPGLAAYSATKAGILQMGKIMAREWVRQGVNVNMICPGYIATDLNADWFATDAGRQQIDGFHRRRLMEESDLDTALLFLASDSSRAITGAVITIDDGQSL